MEGRFPSPEKASPDSFLDRFLVQIGQQIVDRSRIALRQIHDGPHSEDAEEHDTAPFVDQSAKKENPKPDDELYDNRLIHFIIAFCVSEMSISRIFFPWFSRISWGFSPSICDFLIFDDLNREMRWRSAFSFYYDADSRVKTPRSRAVIGSKSR